MSKIKLLIINHLFFPDQSALSQVITDLALGLSGEGFEVTVICSKHEQVKNLDDTLPEEHNINIIYVTGTHFGKAKFVGRILDYLSFYIFSFWSALTNKRPDIVIVTTAPPFIGLVGVVLKIFKSCKLIYCMQDIYPQTAVKLGILKNKMIIKLLEYFLFLILQFSDRIVVIGEDMYEAVTGIYNSEKLVIIHNWADAEKTKPIEKNDNKFILQNNLIGKFIVMYSGNFGFVHEFATLLLAAEMMKNNFDIQFVFIGEGKQQLLIENVISKKKLSNVLMFPFQSRTMLNFSLAAADISMISLVDGLEGYIVPSKIYRLMAAGKSILFLGSKKSAIARIIENAQCGFTIQNNNAFDLVKHIEEQYNDKRINEYLGKNARCYFENNFQRSIAIKKYATTINNII